MFDRVHRAVAWQRVGQMRYNMVMQRSTNWLRPNCHENSCFSEEEEEEEAGYDSVPPIG
jgi:hypothetical protein